MAGSHTDITERKEFESKLAEQNQLLERAMKTERETNEALKRAQALMVQNEKMAGLGQMVAGVAHEINNPLAFITSNVALLQRDFDEILQLVRLYDSAGAGRLARSSRGGRPDRRASPGPGDGRDADQPSRPAGADGRGPETHSPDRGRPPPLRPARRRRGPRGRPERGNPDHRDDHPGTRQDQGRRSSSSTSTRFPA